MVSIYPIEKKFKAIYIPERPDISWGRESLQKSANGSSTNNNQDG